MTGAHADSAARSAQTSVAREAARLAGRRVLVTGARGFLGSHLCEALAAIGASVYAVVRGDVADTLDGVHYMCADLSRESAARSVVAEARPDVAFLLASQGVGSPEVEHLLPCVANDFLATVNVLAAAAERACSRIVLAASMEEPTESHAIPGSPYAAAKWAATGYARMFYDLYRAPVVITRPFMTYGPRQRKYKVIPYTILSLLRGESPLVASGNRLVDWVYVEDTIRGLLAAGALAGIDGGEFDLGSGERVSVRSVVTRISGLTGSTAKPTFGNSDRPQRRTRDADTAATLAGLGWKAEVPLDEGLRRTVEWYRLNAATASQVQQR